MSKAGLFSAAMTTFVAQTYQSLQTDCTAMSVSPLFEPVFIDLNVTFVPATTQTTHEKSLSILYSGCTDIYLGSNRIRFYDSHAYYTNKLVPQLHRGFRYVRCSSIRIYRILSLFECCHHSGIHLPHWWTRVQGAIRLLWIFCFSSTRTTGKWWGGWKRLIRRYLFKKILRHGNAVARKNEVPEGQTVDDKHSFQFLHTQCHQISKTRSQNSLPLYGKSCSV